MSEPHGAIIAPTAHSLGHVQNILNGITTRQLLNTTAILPSMPTRTKSVRQRPAQQDRNKSENVLYGGAQRQKSGVSVHSMLLDSNYSVALQSRDIKYMDGDSMRGDTNLITHRGRFPVTGSSHILHEVRSASKDLLNRNTTEHDVKPYDSALQANLGGTGIHKDSYWRVHLQQQVDVQIHDKDRLVLENEILRSQLTSRSGSDSARLQEQLEQSQARLNALQCGEDKYLAERNMLIGEIQANMDALKEMSVKVTGSEDEQTRLRKDASEHAQAMQDLQEITQRLEVENRHLSLQSTALEESSQQHIKKKNELLKSLEENEQIIRNLHFQNAELSANYQSIQESMKETTSKLFESEQSAKEAMATCMALQDQQEKTSRMKGDIAVESNNIILDQRKECHSFLQAASDAQEQLLAAKRESIREKDENTAKIDLLKEKLRRQEGKYSDLQEKLDESARGIESLTIAHKRVMEEMTDVQNKQKQEQLARQSVEEEFQKTQEQLARLDEKHKDTLKRLAAVNMRLEKSEQSRKQLALQKTTAEDKAKNLELQLDMKNKEFARLLKELEDLKLKYRMQSEQHQQCDYKLQALKEQAQSQIDILNSELHQRQAVTQALTKSLEQQRQKSMENERIYNEHMNRMQEEKRKNDETMHRLLTAAKRMQKRGEEFDSAVKAKQNEISRMDEKLRVQQKEMMAMRGDFEKCKGELGAAKERIRSLEQRSGNSTPSSPSGDNDSLSRRLGAQNAEQKQDISRLRNVAVLAEEAHKNCANNIRRLQGHVRQYLEYVAKNNLAPLVMDDDEEVWSPRDRTTLTEPPSPVMSPQARQSHFFPATSPQSLFPATPGSKIKNRRDKLTPWQETDTDSVDEDWVPAIPQSNQSNPNLLLTPVRPLMTPSPRYSSPSQQQQQQQQLPQRIRGTGSRPQTGTSSKRDPKKPDSSSLSKKDSNASAQESTSTPPDTASIQSRPVSALSLSGLVDTDRELYKTKLSHQEPVRVSDASLKSQRSEQALSISGRDAEPRKSTQQPDTAKTSQLEVASLLPAEPSSPSSFSNIVVTSPDNLLPFSVVDYKGIVAVSSVAAHTEVLKPGSLLLYVNGRYVRCTRDVFDAVESSDRAVLLGFVLPPFSITSAEALLTLVDVPVSKSSYHTIVLDLAHARDTVLPFKDITHARVSLLRPIESTKTVQLGEARQSMDKDESYAASITIPSGSSTLVVQEEHRLPQLNTPIELQTNRANYHESPYQGSLYPQSRLTVNVTLDEPQSKTPGSRATVASESISSISRPSPAGHQFDISIDEVEGIHNFE